METSEQCMKSVQSQGGKENALIVFAYGLIFSFKMLFDKYLEKTPKIFSFGALLSCVVTEMFIGCAPECCIYC